jgi:chitin disaccharide deacetylase
VSRRRLVVTADDFGLAPEVNEAVEAAHRDGILTAASLMVAEPAAADAVFRARRMPGLRVGLHLVLVEGRPVLPPEQVADLVDGEGRFRTDMARLGLDIFARPRARRQLEAEITAQFQAFAGTGIALDHVNAHKHFHLHPTVARAVMRIGQHYGMRALRVPAEPASVLAGIEPQRTRPAAALVAAPWAKLLRLQARRAGLVTPDAVFGLAWSGALTVERLAALIRHLPDGLTEIYAHPATGDAFPGSAPGYRYAEELMALTSALTREALRSSGAKLGGYADLSGPA